MSGLSKAKVLFTSIIIIMLFAITWASLSQGVTEGFSYLFANRWGIATLGDAFFGFITFFAWVAYKERSWLTRLIWFAAIMSFGNVAMSSYVLFQIFCLPKGAKIEDLLLRNPERAL